MTLWRILFGAALLACLVGVVWGLGTVTTTETRFRTVNKIEFEWTSNASGAASGASDASFTGRVERVSVIPDSDDPPSDNYDLQLLDSYDIDLLRGNGANLDSATTYTFICDTLGTVSNEPVTLSVTNAGASNVGTVVVYLR